MDTVSPILPRKRDEHGTECLATCSVRHLSLIAQLPANSEQTTIFSFSPDIFLGVVYFTNAVAPAELAQEVGIEVWTSTVQGISWELSYQLIINTRLDFLVVSSTTFTMILVVVSLAHTVIWVTKTAQHALPHIVLLVANLCLPEVQKHMRQYHMHKAVLLAM